MMIGKQPNDDNSEDNVMKKKTLVKSLALGIPVLFLAACGGDDAGTGKAGTAMPQAQVVTLDARGQEIYATNCQVCHGMANSGAPQSGQLADWQERSDKGMEVMTVPRKNFDSSLPS